MRRPQTRIFSADMKHGPGTGFAHRSPKQMAKNEIAGWATSWGVALVLLGLSCSSNVDVAGRTSSDGTSGAAGPAAIVRKPGADNTPDPAETVAGQFLARVNITPTHGIEFWELQPGNVFTVQTFSSDAGDQRLELADMLQGAGGRYSNLYRKLLNDESALLPPDLVAADEHRRHLPIRDARLPLPAPPIPLNPPSTFGAADVQAAPPRAQPGALQTQGLHSLPPNPYGVNSTLFTGLGYCQWVKADGSCPPGAYYGPLYGGVRETIYWGAEGGNPAGYSNQNNSMSVTQYVGGVGKYVFIAPVAPGYMVEVFAGANPTTYQAAIAGYVVTFAERWRLSFPTLSESGRHPDDGTTQAFMNGLNGITHTSSAWIMSKTQGQNYGGWTEQGCLAQFGFWTDIQNYDGGGRCPHYYNQVQGAGIDFNHFGGIVYDPVTPPGYTPGGNIQQGTGLLFISTNETGAQNGSVIAVDPSNWNYYGFTDLNYGDQVAWVAVDPRTRAFYTSSSDGLAIHQHQITISGAWLQSPWPFYAMTSRVQGACFSSGTTVGFPSCSSDDIQLTNSPGTLDIQGGKVSSHGKLWVTDNTRKELFGIDPYSGIVQVSYPKNTGYAEAEDLDITEGIPSPVSLNVSGSIHLQNLSDGTLTYPWATWQMVNLNVSDLARL